jgi:hypothetical protein
VRNSRRAIAPWVLLALLSAGCDEFQRAEPPATSELSQLEREHPALFDGTAEGEPERTLRVVVPERADGAVELRAAAFEASLRFERLGSPGVMAERRGVWRVYAGGAGPASTVVAAATHAGYDERIAFERAPSASELRYRLQLPESPSGLRLVAGQLELVDAAGAPRLRLAAPVWTGPDGVRVPLELDIEGCAVDRDPAPPWGRLPLAAGARECELVVSWDALDATFPATLEQSWRATTELSIGRQRFGAAPLSAGLLLVAGGLSEAGDPLASAELYDGATGTWAMTSRLELARSDLSLSPAPGGRALAAGGRAGQLALASAELYDAVSGRWYAAPSMPAPRAGHAALALDGGDVLIAGGDDSAEALRFSGQWSSAGELFAPEPGATLSALSGGRALLLGPEAPAAQVYDPATNGWSEAPAPSVARSGHTATRLANGRVLIAGGWSSTPDGVAGPTRAAEVFEPATQTWQIVGATRDTHVFHTATRLPNGRVLLVGGGASLDSELYDPAWGTWTPGPALDAARVHHGAALLADGAVLVIGGARAAERAAADAQRLALVDAGHPPSEETTDVDSPDATTASSPERVLASGERLDPALPATVTTEYRLPARLDRDVTSDAVTELWASVTRPSVLESRRYPLILTLAGNHATCGTGSNPRDDSDCSYTHTGKCPSGFSVVPSHRGFDYMASELAARGYIVVSVNANRGINCGDGDGDDWSMNLARGRLLLRHIERLAAYDRGAARTPASLGVSLESRLDLSEVGLLGHSRGGEGARAAYQQYRDPDSPWPARIATPLAIRAIFEIAPVDGQAPRRLDPDGVAWAALLPMCDGDVSDMQGVRAFDRMLRLASESPATPKATLSAWGANHNFFNTQWQVSDSTGCGGQRPLFGVERGSAEQRQIALGAVLDFFQGSVGAGSERRLGARFDPATPWPSQTRVDRAYLSGIGSEHALGLEDFQGRSGAGQRGLPHLVRGLRLVHSGVPEHDPSARAALLRWESSSREARFAELHFTEAGQGLDLEAYDYLDFRVDRAASPDNPVEPTPLSVQLLGSDDTLSAELDVADYGVLLGGPVSGPRDNPHSMLQTVRLPLADFGEGRARSVRGVRFGLPGAEGGALFIADVRASVSSERFLGQETRVAQAPSASAAPLALAPPVAERLVVAEGDRAAMPLVLRAGNTVRTLAATGSDVEVELASAERFVVQDAALVLEIGGQRSVRSRHPGGDLRRVIFRVDAASFARARDGGTLRVRAATSGTKVWDFGALNKARLRP